MSINDRLINEADGLEQLLDELKTKENKDIKDITIETRQIKKEHIEEIIKAGKLPNLKDLGFDTNRKDEFKLIKGVELYFKDFDDENPRWTKMTHDFLPSLKNAFSGEATFSEIWNSNYDNPVKKYIGKPIAIMTKAGKEVLGFPGAVAGFVIGGVAGTLIGGAVATVTAAGVIGVGILAGMKKLAQGIGFVLNKIWPGVTYPFRQLNKKVRGNDYNLDRIEEANKEIASKIGKIEKENPDAFKDNSTKKSMLRSKSNTENRIPNFSKQDESGNKVLNESEVNKVLNPLVENETITQSEADEMKKQYATMYKYQNRNQEYKKRFEDAQKSEIDPNEFIERLFEKVLPNNNQRQ